MEEQNMPITIMLCGPDNGCEHDFSGWVEYTEPDGAATGTSVCVKCGVRAIDLAMWSD